MYNTENRKSSLIPKLAVVFVLANLLFIGLNYLATKDSKPSKEPITETRFK